MTNPAGYNLKHRLATLAGIIAILFMSACGGTKSAQLSVDNTASTQPVTVTVHMSDAQRQKVVSFQAEQGKPASYEWEYISEDKRPGFPGRPKSFQQLIVFSVGSKTLTSCRGENIIEKSYACTDKGCRPTDGTADICANPN